MGEEERRQGPRVKQLDTGLKEGEGWRGEFRKQAASLQGRGSHWGSFREDLGHGTGFLLLGEWGSIKNKTTFQL